MKNKFKLYLYIVLLILVTVFLLLFLLLNPISSSKNNKIFLDLENKYQGKYGIYVLNTANGKVIEHRANERFPFCSTSKIMIVAAVLKLSMQNDSLLSKRINFTNQELQSSGYAPITQQYTKTGMTVEQLCQAAISYSDNAAANILIKLAGGPGAITRFARSIGDKDFRLDRTEPELNSAIPGDQRDASTPKSMALSLQKLLLGNALDEKQKQLLTSWLIQNTTGDQKIRAAVPTTWVVGDKTGSGDFGTSNDLAIAWPPNNKPIIIAVYFTQPTQANLADSNQVVALAAQKIISII